jgi:hypothetical protein
MNSLEDDALRLGAMATLAHEGCTRGILEDFADALTRLGATLEVMSCTNLLSDSHALFDVISVRSGTT